MYIYINVVPGADETIIIIFSSNVHRDENLIKIQCITKNN